MISFESILGGLNSTVVFIVVLSILIVVHEWGHFITAKLLGVRVLEFALGFGPTLWKKEYNGTDYMLKLFPLGGYVRMAGDERDKCSGAPDEFYSKPVGHRALIVLNGPMINFVLAYLSFVLVFMLGYPGLSTEISEIVPGKAAYHAGLKQGDHIVAINNQSLYGWMHYERKMTGDSVEPVNLTIKREGEEFSKILEPELIEKADLLGQQITYQDIGVGFLPNKIGGLVEGYPAEAAGIQVGDLIVNINGKKISNWTALQKTISSSTGDMIQVEIERDGKLHHYDIQPVRDISEDENGNEIETRKIGIGPMQDFGSYKFGVGSSIVYAWDELCYITELTYKAIFKMATGSMSAKKSVTGPVGIFYIVKGAAEEGLAHLAFILGVISASLAIFNLLPLLPLDGGHIFLLAIEKVRGKPLPERIDNFIAQFGLVLILGLALYVFYADFARFGIFDAFGKLFTKIKSLF